MVKEFILIYEQKIAKRNFKKEEEEEEEIKHFSKLTCDLNCK